MSLLELSGLSVAFGGLKAVDDVSFDVPSNSIVGLIGPNGAGKTTVFNLLTGYTMPSAGKVTLSGNDITGEKTHLVVRRGIVRTFQNIRLFRRMTVRENVIIGYFIYGSYGLGHALLRTPTYWKEEKRYADRAMQLLDLFKLGAYAEREAGFLPYGKQRQLEILRALAAGPKVLLLDEPAAGMNPNETAELMETIRRIKDEFNVSILLIEHDMNLVMGISDDIVVLNYGRVLAHGSPDEIKNDARVIEAYLGEVHEA
jgi:branched-chain amino acid transport system ATP-binding protein